MSSNSSLTSPPLVSPSFTEKLATADLFPDSEETQFDTKSIRAKWLFFAGPGKVASFCLRHGTLSTSSPLPRGIKKGVVKECLKNAGRLALDSQGCLTYCEGWAQMPAHRGLTTYHAWCLDRQGNVVDPTWAHKVGHEYLGVPIKTSALLQQVLLTEQWGFFPHGLYLPTSFDTNSIEFLENNFADIIPE